jgi:hypothetical protein
MYRQKDRQTDRQTNRQTGRQTDKTLARKKILAKKLSLANLFEWKKHSTTLIE